VVVKASLKKIWPK